MNFEAEFERFLSGLSNNSKNKPYIATTSPLHKPRRRVKRSEPKRSNTKKKRAERKKKGTKKGRKTNRKVTGKRRKSAASKRLKELLQ